MRFYLACFVVGAALVTASPGFAHHFFPRASDTIVSLSGTVTRFEMRNPHSYVYVDVRDAAGKTASWQIELGSVAALMRRGWQRDALKAGDVITVNAIIGAHSSSLAAARDVIMPDGRIIFAGSHVGDTKP